MKRCILFALGLLFLPVFPAANAQTTEAKLVSSQKFVISDEDKAAGIGGAIKVAVNVDEKGDVKDALVYIAPEWPCEGSLEGRVRKLMREVESWVKAYKFSPALDGGKPVATRLGLTINLEDKPLKPDPKLPTSEEEKEKLIKAGFINGKAKVLAKPAYPREARAERAAGVVKVQVKIDEEGKVVSAQSISGHGLLHFAAREAACASKFSPTKLQGLPVKVSGIITYNFIP